MADQEEQVSSTTNHEELNHHLDEHGMGDLNEAIPKGIIDVDDEIVDLIGGAQDAIDRHKAEDNVPSSEVPSTLIESEPVHAMEPELLSTPTVTEPEAEPESLPFVTEPEQTPPTSEDATENPLTEEEDPDSAVPETVEVKEVFVPQPEPESTQVAPEPEVVHQPEPIPEPHISAPVEPPTAAPEEVVHPKEAPAKEAPASHAPSPPKAQLHHLMQFPTDHWDSPFLASQENSRASMDTFSKDTAPIGSSVYAADMHSNQSDEDDDLMYEVKKSNPFQGFSPVADAGFSHFGDTKPDHRAAKMSESPTPDLVQYGLAGETQDSPPSIFREDKSYDSVKMTGDSVMQPQSQFLSGPKDEEDSPLPPSLPDILKSSPLNPDKIDSGSSEGSPEEQSPILERRMMESPNPPINLSANNPFAFDSKISLLKEMAEETEAKAAEKTKYEDDQGFGAFDLVKEAEETSPAKGKEEKSLKMDQKDWFSSDSSPKVTDKFEPLNFQSKMTPAEDSDSESPTADSLSPVLEAMAKNPAIFQVETEKKEAKMEVEEAEVAEEASEPEVSSEEFEFIERPPRGVIDEFLEALDNSKFSKTSDVSMDDDLSFGTRDTILAPTQAKAASAPEVDEDAPSQSSYLLLTQDSQKSSSQKGKADLEKLEVKQLPSQGPVIHTPVKKPEENVAKKNTDGANILRMVSLRTEAVVDLLYWRDVKTTGVVFGAALLLLLSLTVCSIVSVCSYVGLALLSVTIAFRIYKGILQAIQKSDEGHPFKLYLDKDVALSEDTVHKYSDVALARINKTMGDLRRLFLVEDLVDSIKFAVFMWILTYVGALFNGLTILILGLVAAFSCPIIYEKHQAQIDHYVGMVNNQIKDIVAKIQAKVPGMKRKAD